jgi:hypothetical protein
MKLVMMDHMRYCMAFRLGFDDASDGHMGTEELLLSMDATQMKD